MEDVCGFALSVEKRADDATFLRARLPGYGGLILPFRRRSSRTSTPIYSAKSSCEKLITALL